MKPITDFYEAWQFLETHRMFDYQGSSQFHQCFEIEVVKVNPETKAVDDDERKNTETRVWLECGPYEKPEDMTEAERKHFPYGNPTVDMDLACGGATFEEAIVQLAVLVLGKYGS